MKNLLNDIEQREPTNIAQILAEKKQQNTGEITLSLLNNALVVVKHSLTKEKMI